MNEALITRERRRMFIVSGKIEIQADLFASICVGGSGYGNVRIIKNDDEPYDEQWKKEKVR